jgi:hypothetical protein
MLRTGYHHHIILALTAFLIAFLSGCDLFFNLPHLNPVDPDSPDHDSTPPEIIVTSHEDGQIVNRSTQVIEGTLSDRMASAFIKLSR